MLRSTNFKLLNQIARYLLNVFGSLKFTISVQGLGLGGEWWGHTVITRTERQKPQPRCCVCTCRVKHMYINGDARRTWRNAPTAAGGGKQKLNMELCRRIRCCFSAK